MTTMTALAITGDVIPTLTGTWPGPREAVTRTIKRAHAPPARAAVHQPDNPWITPLDARSLTDTEHPMTSNDSTTAAAVAVVDSYSRALEAGDKDTICSLYSEAAEIVPEALPSLTGPQAVAQFYTETFANLKLTGALRVLSAEVYGDIALVRCEEPITVRELPDGQDVHTWFRELFVLRSEDAWAGASTSTSSPRTRRRRRARHLQLAGYVRSMRRSGAHGWGTIDPARCCFPCQAALVRSLPRTWKRRRGSIASGRSRRAPRGRLIRRPR